jgi:hypothetical protein
VVSDETGKKGDEKPAENRDEAAREQQPVAAAQIGQVEKKKSENNCCGPSEGKHWIERVIEGTTLLLALGAAIASALSAKYSGDQATAAREANKLTQTNLRTQNRPWLGLSGPINVVSPLTFDADGATLKFDLPIKNGGGSPAKDVYTVVSPIIGVLLPNGPIPPGNVIQAKFGPWCDPDSVRKANFGALVLPGDFFPSDPNLAAPKIPKTTFTPTAWGEVEAWFGICVGYKDQFNEPHATVTVLEYWTNLTTESRLSPKA